MSEALTYLLDIYRSFITFVFDTMEIESGVTFGWVILSGIIFIILIRNILALPSKSTSIQLRGKENGNN